MSPAIVCQWDHFWGYAGPLLANFFGKVNSAQFFVVSDVVNCSLGIMILSNNVKQVRCNQVSEQVLLINLTFFKR